MEFLRVRKMANLTLTIIVPIYNVEKYLGQCLDSLISKECTGKYEVLLVDDCGKDSSIEIAKEYLNQHPNIFTLIRHNTNKGLSAARNTGLAQAKSRYTMFIDSDDWLSEGCVLKILNELETHSPDFLFFDYIRSWEDEDEPITFDEKIEKPQLLDDKLYCSLLQKISVNAWAKVFLTDHLQRFEFPEGILFEDVALIPLVIVQCKKKLYLPQIKYFYRQREDSIMGENMEDAKGLFHAYKKLYSICDEEVDDCLIQDFTCILTRNWLTRVRIAYRRGKHRNSIEFLDNGISFFNKENNKWHKNKNLISYLASDSYLSKMKTKILLSLIKNKFFTSIFLLQVNYTPITFSNIKPLIIESYKYKSKRNLRTNPDLR